MAGVDLRHATVWPPNVDVEPFLVDIVLLCGCFVLIEPSDDCPLACVWAVDVVELDQKPGDVSLLLIKPDSGAALTPASAGEMS